MALGSKVETGSEDDGVTSLFEFVVRIKRLLVKGNLSESRDVRFEMGDVGEMGSERVEGRLRPGKDVTRTLIISRAISDDATLRFRPRASCGVTPLLCD